MRGYHTISLVSFETCLLVSAEKDGERGHEHQAEGLERGDAESPVAVVGVAGAVLGVDAQDGGFLAGVFRVTAQNAARLGHQVLGDALDAGGHSAGAFVGLEGFAGAFVALQSCGKQTYNYFPNA